jgi:hypothetical protein
MIDLVIAVSPLRFDAVRIVVARLLKSRGLLVRLFRPLLLMEKALEKEWKKRALGAIPETAVSFWENTWQRTRLEQ